MKINDRAILAANPFWVSELIGFYNHGYGGEIPFELVYLMPPLILRKDSRIGISKLNTSSTIYSAFLEHKEKRTRIAGLQKYVEYYRYLVNPALIVYANKGNALGRKLTNNCLYKYSSIESRRIKEYCKAAHNLGVIFSKESPADCFYKLGVFSI